MSILFPAGNTCEIYQYGWQSTGCTNSAGVTRGFTQEWYFDGDLSSWVAITEEIEIPVGATGDVVSVDASGFTVSSALNIDSGNKRVSVVGNLTNNVFTTIIAGPVSGTYTISMKDSNVHKVDWSKAAGYSGISSLRFNNPPPSGTFGEITLFMENSPAATPNGELAFIGQDIDGNNNSGISFESDINLSGTTHEKMYKFKVFTFDGGDQYYVQNDSGTTFGWDLAP